ncbi:embryo-specific protein ATS3B-like [Iris pallida]|uniref:Embryo-specific protein ATS3B-like n=1 Tax=Iris pallida TaxID=29817 RepID=A0AAX6I449_IRIPA|nr:embryo-specific protein ATS3B-like [Iris pallida]
MAGGLFFLLLLIILIFPFLLALDGPVNPHPQELKSFQIREHDATALGEDNQGGCSYTVKIKTSCSSPKYTRDAISAHLG